MALQHPLAYILVLEGIALLRALGGGFDTEFIERRIDEARRLLPWCPEAAETAFTTFPATIVWHFQRSG